VGEGVGIVVGDRRIRALEGDREKRVALGLGRALRAIALRDRLA
jgi:hypothetical protein